MVGGRGSADIDVGQGVQSGISPQIFFSSPGTPASPQGHSRQQGFKFIETLQREVLILQDSLLVTAPPRRRFFLPRRRRFSGDRDSGRPKAMPFVGADSAAIEPGKARLRLWQWERLRPRLNLACQ